MDNRLTELFGLFESTLDSLRSSNHSPYERIDILLFLLLWKHQSDSGVLKGDVNLYNFPTDVTAVKARNLVDTVSNRLNGKDADAKLDMASIIGRDAQIVASKIIQSWSNSSNLKLGCLTEASIEEIFNWINDYLGNSTYGASEYLTPRSIVTLISSCVRITRSIEVYDPFCRSGNLLDAVVALHPKSKGFGVSRGGGSLKLAKIKAIMHGSPVTIRTEYVSTPKKYDFVVTNPPFNVTAFDKLPVIGDWSDKYRDAKSDIAFLAHGIDSISDQGTCAIVLPTRFLSSGATDKKIRQELVDQQILEGIVTLPGGLFYDTVIPAVIVFVSKKKGNKNIRMVDASGFIKNTKGRNILSDTDIQILSDVYKTDSVLDSNSEYGIDVSFEEVIKSDYDLRYGTFKKRTITPLYRPSKIILSEISKLEAELARLQAQFHKLV